jgi:hypothetical protein
MNKGKMVRLRTYQNKEIIMRVLRQDGHTLIVCTPEEYYIAQLECREPRSVGFHIKYFLGDCTETETKEQQSQR